MELKTNPDGSPNPKYVDLLEEDRPISGQKFVCVSFVSPENVLKDKNLFFFEEFLKQWDFSKSIEKYNQFLNFISYKYNLDFDKLTSDLKEFVNDEKDNLVKTTIEDDYKSYIDVREQELEDTFNSRYNFQTSTRGIKVRGVFSTQEEAELRCKLLREVDPNHDVYVGPVGMWMPWEPEAYKTGRVEYMEEELNQLMKEKQLNEEKAKEQFEARVKQSKIEAIEKNKKLAGETGNKLTQNVDKDGNLIGVGDAENAEVSVADIRKELFESENVVVGTDSDHGLSRLTENQKKDEVETIELNIGGKSNLI